MASLMNNWSDAQKALQTAQNSQGSAEREEAHYEQSVQYRIDQAKASLQELSYNFLSSDFLKNAISAGNTFLSIVNSIVSALGSVKSIALTIGSLDFVKGLVSGDKGMFANVFKFLANKRTDGGASQDDMLENIKTWFFGNSSKKKSQTDESNNDNSVVDKLNNQTLALQRNNDQIEQATDNLAKNAKAKNDIVAEMAQNGEKIATDSQPVAERQAQKIKARQQRAIEEAANETPIFKDASRMEKAGEEAGQSFSKGMTNTTKNTGAKITDNIEADLSSSVGNAGEKTGSSLANGLTTGLNVAALVASLAMVAVSVGAAIYDATHVSYEEASKAFQSSNSEAQQASSQLQSLQEQYDQTKQSAQELLDIKQSGQSLSLTQSTELQNLQQEEESLRNQIVLQQQLAKIKAEKAAADAKLEADTTHENESNKIEEPNAFKRFWNKISNSILAAEYGQSGQYDKQAQIIEEQSQASAKLTNAQQMQDYINNIKKSQQEYRKAQKQYTQYANTIKGKSPTKEQTEQLTKYEKAMEDVSDKINDYKSAGATLYETLQAETDAFKASSDSSQFQDYIDKNMQLMTQFRQLDMSAQEKQLDNINQLFDGSDTSTNLLNYLEKAVQNGQKASDVIRQLGIDLNSLNIDPSAFDNYFDGLISDVDKAKQKVSEFDGSLQSVEDAFNSDNADASFEKVVDYAKKAQNLYETGKVGTDDFKTFVEFISPKDVSNVDNVDSHEWNVDAYTAEYDAMKSKIDRYFKTDSSDATVEIQSMQNALDDLTSSVDGNGQAMAALATKSSDGSYHWTQNFKSSADAAKKWGISIESAETVLHNLETYGFEFGDKFEFKGEELEKYKESLDGLQSIYDDMKKNNPEDSYTKTLGNLLSRWNGDYAKMQEDINNLSKDDVVRLKVELDYAQAQQQLQQAKTNIANKGGQADATDYAAELAAQQTVISTGESNNEKLKSFDVNQYSDAMSVAKRIQSQMVNETGADLANSQKQLAALYDGIIAFQQKSKQTPGLKWSDFVNTNEAKNAFSTLSDQLKKELSIPITPKFDASQAQSELKKLSKGQSITITADVDGIDSQINAVKDQKGNITYTANIDGVTKQVTQIQHQDGTISYTADVSQAIKALNNGESIKIRANVQGVQQDIEAVKDQQGTITYTANVNGAKENVFAIKDENGTISYTPNVSAIAGLKFDKQAGVYYRKKGQEAPKPQNSLVHYVRGSQQPPQSGVNATVNYVIGSQQGPSNRVAYVTYITSGQIGAGSGRAEEVNFRTGTKRFTTGLIGTTYGAAFSSGSIDPREFDLLRNDPTNQTRSSTSALVGQLGPQMIVNGNRWWTVGNNGAEFTHIPSGSVIFDAWQTKQLLENGSIYGRGQAYLSGTAYKTASVGYGGPGIGNYLNKNNQRSQSINTSAQQTAKASAQAAKSSAQAASSAAKAASSSSKAANSSNSSTEKTKQTLDWIEILIKRTQRQIDILNRISQNQSQTYGNRDNAISGQLNWLNTQINYQQQGADRYIQQANSVGLSEDWASKVRNGKIDIEDITDEDLKNKITDYQSFYEKALQCKDAVYQLKQKEQQLYKTRFDNVQGQFDNAIEMLTHEAELISKWIDVTQQQGHIVGNGYYKSLIELQDKHIKDLSSQYDELNNSLADAVNNGDIAQGTQQWYAMKKSIHDVENAIVDANKQLATYKQNLKQLTWDKQGYVQDRIDDLNTQFKFLYDIMNSSQFFDKNGLITETGTAAFGLDAMQFDTYLRKAQLYKEQIKEINKDLAEDPDNTTYLKHRQQIVKSYQDAVKSAKEQKDTIKDLVKTGYDKQISSLQKLINKYEDLLDDEKSSRQYADQVTQKQKTITDLQKQIMATANDNSEEGRATRQKTKENLEKAQKDLVDTQDERSIASIKSTLSNLTTMLQQDIDNRLDGIDELIIQVISGVNQNGANISNTITAQANEYGITLSSNVKDILDKVSNSIGDIEGHSEKLVTNFSDGTFKNESASVLAGINGIKAVVEQMYQSANKKSDEKVKQVHKQVTKPTASKPVQKPQPKPSPKPAQTPKRSEKDNYGVALAIWNGGYGWGNDPFRSGVLKKKGFDAARVQQIVNEIAPYVRNGSWYGRFYGIKDLSPYAYNHYSSGTNHINRKELAWTNEGAQQAIIRKSDGAVLTRLNPGDTVFNGMATKRLWDFGNNPRDFLRSLNISTVPSMQNMQNISANYQINFNLPNVTNSNEFMNELKSNPQFEKMIQEMTLGRIVGNNTLKKNSINFR